MISTFLLNLIYEFLDGPGRFDVFPAMAVDLCVKLCEVVSTHVPNLHTNYIHYIGLYRSF